MHLCGRWHPVGWQGSAVHSACGEDVKEEVRLRIRFRLARILLLLLISGCGCGGIRLAWLRHMPGGCACIACILQFQRLTAPTCRRRIASFFRLSRDEIALARQPFLHPSSIFDGPEGRDDRAECLPFLRRNPHHDGKALVIVRQAAVRRPPRKHQESQVCAMFLVGEVRRVCQIGVSEERKGWKISHRIACFRAVGCRASRWCGGDGTLVRFAPVSALQPAP